MKNVFLLLLISTLLNSCKTVVKSEALVYSNDFENNDVSNIQNGVTTIYNKSGVLGRFNNGGFTLKLNNLPKHILIRVTFDLYIHDNWRGQLPPDGPDIWEMFIDDTPYISTTFSNLACLPGNICPPQSYPANYPNNYSNPRASAYRVDLPGACAQLAAKNGSSQYKISKTFTHSNTTFALQCIDKLNQINHADPKCDKSWSVDNIMITAIAE